jgi:hypothetical protein
VNIGEFPVNVLFFCLNKESALEIAVDKVSIAKFRKDEMRVIKTRFIKGTAFCLYPVKVVMYQLRVLKRRIDQGAAAERRKLYIRC